MQTTKGIVAFAFQQPAIRSWKTSGHCHLAFPRTLAPTVKHFVNNKNFIKKMRIQMEYLLGFNPLTRRTARG